MPYKTVRYFYLISLICGVFWLSVPSGFSEPKNTFIQTIVNPDTPVYAGQKIPFFITLYSKTRFTGVPRFELPQIPHLIFMEIEDRPVLGSIRENDTEFLTKTHEFAVFAQQEGTFSIPSFSVSFAYMDITTNAVVENTHKTNEMQIEVTRPPGTQAIDSIISTRKFELQSTWDPTPKVPKVGDAFKRTITRTASDIPGMVFLPIQPEPTAGISFYEAPPSVQDSMERGDFSGKRIDTITYVCEQEGQYEIQELTFYWFDLEKKELRTERLDPVVLNVSPAPQNTNEPAPGGTRNSLLSGTSSSALWTILAAALVCIGLFRTRVPIARQYTLWKQQKAVSEKTFFQAFETACRSDNDEKILQTLFKWLDRLEPNRSVLSIRDCFTAFHDPELIAAFSALEQQAYGAPDGKKRTEAPLASNLLDLVRQYRKHRLKTIKNQQVTANRLDPLNPS